MKTWKKSHSLLTGVAFFLAALMSEASASITDCQNLYIGRIWLEQGQGLKGAVFLNDPADASGSYWVWFSNFSIEEKKSVLAVLTTAKIMQHRVHIATTETNGCGIQNAQTIATTVLMANSP